MVAGGGGRDQEESTSICYDRGETVSAVAQTLSLLSCPACDAPVALAREATVRCPFCGGQVAVPESYRSALDVAEREVAADALTHRAFATLGKPPSLLLRALAAMTGGVGRMILTTFLTLVVVVHLLNACIDHAARWFHVNVRDWLSNDEQALLFFGLTFVALLAIFALALFGRRRAGDLQKLHRALAAQPPARAGGPARCRDCGAPLTVPEGALGVRCAYCKCDNLVAIDAAWIGKARGGAARVAHEAKSVLARHRYDVRRLRLHLAIRLAVIGALAWLVLASTVRRVAAGGGDLDLRAALAAVPRRMIDAQAHATSLPPPGPAAPRVPIDQCAARYLVKRGEDITCNGGECAAGWFVPMRRGERFEIAPIASGTARWFEHYEGTGWTQAYGRADGWGTERGSAPVAPGKPAQFTAAVTSWYRVTLELHDVGDGFDVCAALR